VRNSPAVDDLQGLSRQVERRVLGHYGYPAYWGATGIWGSYGSPAELLADQPPAAPPVAGEAEGADSGTKHLRSLKKTTGFHIHARDGEIGHVDDFLIDQETWKLRYLLVDTSNWIGGRWVIVSADALEQVDPDHRLLHVATTRDEVLHAPSLESIESALALSEIGAPFTII
jgi:hypothetical protein